MVTSIVLLILEAEKVGASEEAIKETDTPPTNDDIKGLRIILTSLEGDRNRNLQALTRNLPGIRLLG